MGSSGETRHEVVVDSCYSTATVSGDRDVGGLVGGVGSPICKSGGGRCRGEIHIKNCSSAGMVSGNENVGGLVGRNSYGGIITNCYSTTMVTGDSQVGGLVGQNFGSIGTSYSTGTVSGSTYVGGLVGWNPMNGLVIDCYSVGKVEGNEHVGGLVGCDYHDLAPGTTTDGFWDMETSGQTSSKGGTGKTTVEMQTASTFLEAGWDFVNVWGIGENQTYPYLRKYSAADINQDESVDFGDLATLAENWLRQQP